MIGVHRQHAITTIPELRGQCCLAFTAVLLAGKKRYALLYLQLPGGWHRFYLDAGLLFWEEGTEPDPDNDLLEGECYVDLGKELRVLGSMIAEIEMTDCQLMMKFDNGACLVLKNGVNDDGAEVVEFVSGIRGPAS